MLRICKLFRRVCLCEPIWTRKGRLRRDSP